MQPFDIGARHANTPLKVSKEIDLFDDHFAYDTIKRFTIMFDMPKNYRAKMIILNLGKPFLVVTAFSWNETLPLRKKMKYGDNHRCDPVSWQSLKTILEEMCEDKISVSMFTSKYDKRIIMK